MNDKTRLSNWRKLKIIQCKEFPPYLFYLSKKENFESIVENGILPKSKAKKKSLSSKSFADIDVQDIRDRVTIYISNNKPYNLHDLVPLYFKALTPTLSVIRKQQENLFFCKVSSQKLISDTSKEFAFTNGNAASGLTASYHSLNNLAKINWEIINSEFWTDKEDGKRIRNAEFLIYPKIEIKYIFEFSVNNQKLKEELEDILLKNSIKIPVTIDKRCFFTT